MAKLVCDKFGDDMHQQMYRSYRQDDLQGFMKFCVEAIENHTVSNKMKKDTFIRGIRGCRTKEQILQKATNIFLAGEGLAVAA